MRCQGNAKNGERKCKHSTWNANSLYCKWHDPKIIKCKGIAKNSGKRCGLHENLSSTGYCRYHETQDPQYSKKKSKERIQAYPSRCKGFAATTNQQCRIDWDLDEYGYCKYHKNQGNGLYGNQRLLHTEDEEVRLRYQLEEVVEDSGTVISRTLQCRGITLAGRRCGIHWNLNEKGYCMYHRNQVKGLKSYKRTGDITEVSHEPFELDYTPSLLTEALGIKLSQYGRENRTKNVVPNENLNTKTLSCKGVAKSTGQSCRIRWGLDENGYCIHHIHQAEQSHLEQKSSQINSNATMNGNDDLYYKNTTSNEECSSSVSQCRGTAKSTGKSCRITWGLDDNGFCAFHRKQGSSTQSNNIVVGNNCAKESEASYDPSLEPGDNTSTKATACKGIAKSTGKQCRIVWGLDDHGYCHFHRDHKKYFKPYHEPIITNYSNNLWDEEYVIIDSNLSLVTLSPRKTNEKKLETKYTDYDDNPTAHKSSILHQNGHSRRILQG